MPDLPKRYENLHVYLVEGVVPREEEAGLGEAFLGNWVEGESSFLFFSRPSREKVNDLIVRHGELRLLEEHRFAYEDWQGTKLDPVRVDYFLILPPWHRNKAGKKDIPIVLDPGVVFGTGIHPTTRDCLRAMADLRGRHPFEGVLDLGTGTGILALAAARLGAKHVFAVDLNPLCVKTAKRNVELNGLGKVVEVVEGKAEDFTETPADLLVANIHCDALKELVMMKGIGEKPWLILSGLMRSQARDIKAMLERDRRSIVREWDGDGIWTTILAAGSQ